MSQYNDLTEAQEERLAILLEELAEAGQAAAKVLRHGYRSYDPTNPDVRVAPNQMLGRSYPDNQNDLEKELGHVQNAIRMLTFAGEIEIMRVEASRRSKSETVRKYLHHRQVDQNGNPRS